MDCAYRGTLASEIGVGVGFGFAGEAEAGWLSAVPAMGTAARIINKTIRTTGCIRSERGVRGRRTFCVGS